MLFPTKKGVVHRSIVLTNTSSKKDCVSHKNMVNIVQLNADFLIHDVIVDLYHNVPILRD